MNSLKHITDWPTAGSSVDWKGIRGSLNNLESGSCPSCKQYKTKMSNSVSSLSNGKSRMFQNYRIKRVGQSFMDPDVINTGIPGSGSTTVVEFQLQFQDINGNAADVDVDDLNGASCEIEWYVEYQIDQDNPNLNVMVCKAWPGGPCGTSLIGGPGQIIKNSKTTSILLITNTVNVEQFITLGVNLQNCNSTWAPAGGSNPRKTIKLSNETYVGPGSIAPCPVDIQGPMEIECNEAGFYNAVSPNHPHYSHYYQWEIDNPNWLILPGKHGNDFIQLIPPSASFLSMHPEHRFVKLCVWTSGSGCELSKNCIWVKANCKLEAGINPNIFDNPTNRWGIRGTATPFEGSQEFEVDWSAICRRRGTC
ncbi:MAG: hypothetical protein WD048_10680 [Chitinophagales bacterium]